MLIRVLEIPPSTGNFHFSDGEEQIFIEVDWFKDDTSPLDPTSGPMMAYEGGRKQIEEFIKAKKYFNPSKSYLVLHQEHSFTINYSAP